MTQPEQPFEHRPYAQPPQTPSPPPVDPRFNYPDYAPGYPPAPPVDPHAPVSYPDPAQDYPPGYPPPPAYYPPPSQPGPPGYAGYSGHSGYPDYSGYPGYPGPPAYSDPYDPYRSARASGTNGLAIGSLISSIGGIPLAFVYVGIAGWIAGIVLGIVALNQIKVTHQEGRGLAIAGIAVGAAGLALATTIALLIVAVAANRPY